MPAVVEGAGTVWFRWGRRGVLAKLVAPMADMWDREFLLSVPADEIFPFGESVACARTGGGGPYCGLQARLEVSKRDKFTENCFVQGLILGGLRHIMLAGLMV